RKRRGSRTTSRIPLAVLTRDMIFTAIFRVRVVVRKTVAVVGWRVIGQRAARVISNNPPGSGRG
ncbi:MAG: hypothetical protein MUF51_07995, partial [Vicinamibacteria bacterium]|nr:hypothetical protein [Vicinamibacteria bacterium]